ncbi:DUF4376 domain-containing protein [Roseateles sp. SL47]|uniref:DUF4376 domain-containing protein n=1 Tax=Roseateles sp. SL47 TaxID=2995138 RepID=UPI002271FFCE|nr:DUF4376 domain-containing protein [Roseateles sp. SL47]WAC72066.1 DUF4376 domain-containing protein [Roseateles sp. SL47]
MDMPILKILKAKTGALCSIHQVLHMETNLSQLPTSFLVRVASYAGEEEALAEQPAAHWPPLEIPFHLLNFNDVIGSVEQILIAAADSPFIGGSRIAPVTDLAKAKARRWGEIKQLREAIEFGPLLWDGSTFQADVASQDRIKDAARRAERAIAAGVSLSETWTLADNSFRLMSAADLIALDAARSLQVSGAHEIARQLREQIDASPTPEAVRAVDWPQ